MTAPAPLPPGRYLQLRREAAGLTIEQVAVRIAPRPSRWHSIAAQLTALEAGEPIPGGTAPLSLAMSLAQAFPFNFGTWEALAELALDPASDLPVPKICVSCGCTWCDPCSPPCAWLPLSLTGGVDRCSACAAAPELAA